MTADVKNATIERLRANANAALSAAEGRRPTNEQVSAIVAGLRTCDDLATISRKSGLPEKRVLDVVADLGTWLTHSNKGAPKARIESAEEALLGVLFLGVWSHNVPEKEGHKRKRKRKRSGNNVLPEDLKVTVPPGFEPKGFHKRDVSKALAAIVVAAPDDATIARFVARTYQIRSAALNYPMLSGVWYFAQCGRLDKIDAVNAKDPVFHSQVVAAYDLLDIARRDAIDGIEVLVEQNLEDLDRLESACVKARWVAEQEITRLEKLIAAAKVRPTSLKTLEREIRYFADRVKHNEAIYKPSDISKLNVGQIQRIAQAAGLPVEGGSREEESQIRSKLKELGLSSDLDRLLPEGLRAAKTGQLDEFWDVMKACVDGDITWAQQLEELLSERV